MTRLSVNVNKIATLRNARGGDNPNLVQVVKNMVLKALLFIHEMTKGMLP